MVHEGSPEIAVLSPKRIVKPTSLPPPTAAAEQKSPTRSTSGAAAAARNVPCRFPTGCDGRFSSAEECLEHIERIHWHLSGDSDGMNLRSHHGGMLNGGDRSNSEGPFSNSAERSSNSEGPLRSPLTDDSVDLAEDSLTLTSLSHIIGRGRGSPPRPRVVCPFECDDIDEDTMADHLANCHPDMNEPPEEDVVPASPKGTAKSISHDKQLDNPTTTRPTSKRAGSVASTPTERKAKSEPSAKPSPVASKRPRKDDENGNLSNGKPGETDSIALGVPATNRRYPKRDNTGPDMSYVNAQRASQKELTAKIRKILTPPEMTNGKKRKNDDDSSEDGYSDDPLDRLRSIAAVFSMHIHEINDMGYTKSGGGYCTSYVERLQSLLDESAETDQVIIQVGEIVRQMDESDREYQKPDDDLRTLIVRAASNGKKPPGLCMCEPAGFYGKDLGDAGWGCGYRNAQMLASALLKGPPYVAQQLRVELGHDYVPNISRLQQLIHRAWELGFDGDGAGELNNAVTETSKWIGTTEIFALFSSMRIECAIRDFSNGNGDLPMQLFTFCRTYFSDNRPGRFRGPLCIQYSGHSRTVIGVDTTGIDCNPSDPKLLQNIGLLIFDPGQSQWDIEIQGNPTRTWYKAHIYRPMVSFKEQTYSILYFTGNILTDEQYEAMKQPGAGHFHTV